MIHLHIGDQQVARDLPDGAEEAEIGMALDVGELEVANHVGAVLVALAQVLVVVSFVVLARDQPIRGAYADPLGRAQTTLGLQLAGLDLQQVILVLLDGVGQRVLLVQRGDHSGRGVVTELDELAGGHEDGRRLQLAGIVENYHWPVE